MDLSDQFARSGPYAFAVQRGSAVGGLNATNRSSTHVASPCTLSGGLTATDLRPGTAVPADLAYAHLMLAQSQPERAIRVLLPMVEPTNQSLDREIKRAAHEALVLAFQCVGEHVWALEHALRIRMLDAFELVELRRSTAIVRQRDQALEQVHIRQLNEISELRTQNRVLERLAFEDHLTGIANRRSFERQLTRLADLARRDRKPLSLIMIDLDHFKRINDSYSHATGDVVLCRIAELLTGECRVGDVSARYGGEEMVVLLPNTAEFEARNIAERLRRAVEALSWADVAPMLRVTISAGVATVGDGDAKRLQQDADRNLYRAKRDGRNRVSDSQKISLPNTDG